MEAGQPWAGAAKVLVGMQCDAIVFPELGMHPSTLGLAMGRWAPVQLTTHGHSMRPCLGGTIDAFITLGAAAETQGSQAHLANDDECEQEVRLPDTCGHSGFDAPGAPSPGALILPFSPTWPSQLPLRLAPSLDACIPAMLQEEQASHSSSHSVSEPRTNGIAGAWSPKAVQFCDGVGLLDAAAAV